MNSIRHSRERTSPRARHGAGIQKSGLVRKDSGFPRTREGREPAEPAPADGDRLLEQQHLSDGVELAARLQAIEVNPRRQALAVVIRRVPSD